MITCSPAPGSIVKACLLAQINGDLPCLDSGMNVNLFSSNPGSSVDQQPLADLIQRAEQGCGLDTHWLQASPGRTLARLIAANLRFQPAGDGELIFAAVEQALRYGHAYCLCGIGDISRLFLHRAKTVLHEVHRMTGFIRFCPGPGNILAAQPKLFHRTGDWILRKFAVKYPDNKLVLVLPSEVLIFEQGQLASSPDVDVFLPYVQADPFSSVWETYYRSQYIAARKNKKAADRVIPRKYRNWLAEGKILDEELGNRAKAPDDSRNFP